MILDIIPAMNEKLYQDLSILITEDEPNVMQEMQEILSLYFGYVHSAKDGCEGLKLIDKYHPDIIISDIQMPCMSGLEMLEEANKFSVNSIFIITSAFNNTEYLLSAIDHKVDAYLIKPFKFEKLLEKIEKSLQERAIINGEKSSDSSTISPVTLLHNTLSSREYEVFLDIAKGIKPNNIAQKYSIKPKTISTYRKRILEKMCLNSNAEIIRYAITHKLI